MSGSEDDTTHPPSFTSLEELQLYNKNALKKAAANQQSPQQLTAAGEETSKDSLESTLEQKQVQSPDSNSVQ